MIQCQTLTRYSKVEERLFLQVQEKHERMSEVRSSTTGV